MILVIDSSRVREGKLEELKAAIDELVQFVETNEARPLAYNVYLDEDGATMTVTQVHPDSASMERHMRRLFEKIGSRSHSRPPRMSTRPTTSSSSSLAKPLRRDRRSA